MTPPHITNGSYRYEFERPLAELEHRLHDLRKAPEGEKNAAAIRALELQRDQLKQKIYGALTAWQRVQLARHPQRPYTLDYVRLVMTDFLEIHGDRLYGDDKALLGGFARLNGRSLLVLGHQKGRDTKDNLMRNFGSAHPEGYRKALRLMQMAEKFHLPIVVLIDTPGAYPGIGAEERGQAHSIAYNLREMARVRAPIYICVIGEGGSGGALGVGIGDWIAQMENAYYSVISPEGCAAILWRDRAKAPEAAEALKLTANDLLHLQLVEEMISEPSGGAHHNPAVVAEQIKEAILRFWKSTASLPGDELVQRRYDRFRRFGAVTSSQPAAPVSAIANA